MGRLNYVVLGSGAMGLALAYELAPHGSVLVVEHRHRNPASWAAAGILPPASCEGAHDHYQALVAASGALHAEWAVELEQASGVSVEYVRSGALHLARSAGEAAALTANVEQWRSDGVEVVEVDLDRLNEWEPSLQSMARAPSRCYFVPAEAQVRPPRFLRALRSACELRGVQFCSTAETPVIQRQANGCAIQIADRFVRPDYLCVAGGAWTSQILEPLGVRLELTPVRGQMVLFRPPDGRLVRILNEGPNYVVPRRDGRILVGSTMEEVGFEETNTQRGIDQLVEFARQLIPALNHEAIESVWAGLRPKSGDGFPYLGPVPGLERVFICTGHYRSGILLAPATARMLGTMIRGDTPSLDLSPFRLDREAIATV